MQGSRIATSSSLALLIAQAAAGQVPLGPPLQVNTYTQYQQKRPAVASAANGDFVVAWESYGQDGGGGYFRGAAVFVRRYTASGAPLGPETRANAYTTDSQQFTDVASDPLGNFVVVWTSSGGQDGSESGVFGRRYAASGAVGPEFRVNTYTTGYQLFPSIAVDGSGAFVVVWESFGQEDAYPFAGIYGQRYAPDGTPLGPEFRVNSYTTSAQRWPSVATDASGNFVVVWASYAQDGDDKGVFGQRYDAAGTPQGGEFQVNVVTLGEQSRPSVAMAADGEFVVVWESVWDDSFSDGVWGRRYDAAGVPEGGEFHVNEPASGEQDAAEVAMTADGGFVAAWSSARPGGGYDMVGRMFDPAGVPLGEEFPVNTSLAVGFLRPSLATAADGRFVAAWTGLDAHASGVFAQRYTPDADLIFADGFESGNLAAWSAAATDGGDLGVSATAALKSTVAGLRGVIDDTAGLYVEDRSPADEDRYRARFYIDTNGFDPGEASGARRTRIFIAFEEAPLRRLAAIVLRRVGGVYGVMGRARLDDNSQADTGFFTVAPGVHFVEMDWKRSSGPDANDGFFHLWIDGAAVSTLNGLDNSRSAVDLARLGALSVKATADGTLYWDEFQSRRATYIGP